MNIIIFLSLLTIISVLAHGDHKKKVHQCMHDQIDVSKMVPHDYLDTFEEKYADRKLQKSTPQPIRITFDYKEIDNPANGAITPQQKQYVKNIMESAKVYLSKLIKVYPRTQPIKMTWGDICFDVKVPKEVQEIGVSNSDLHIYVSYSNQPKSGFVANAMWCQLDPNPTFGRVSLNIGAMITDQNDTLAFQDNFSTSLHEILHILGFSGSGINYWIDPDTGKPYGNENSSKILKIEERWGEKGVNKISSKNILKVARNHYGCPSMDGMYLENQGSLASKGSHWESDLLGNEFMTPSVIHGVYTISEFTAALLLDTGYYAEINYNMLMPIYWGKNKGCDFFNKACNSTQSFPEFLDPKIGESCDFFSQGVGPNSNLGFSQCNTIITSDYMNCQDIKNKNSDEKLVQNIGSGSRCFKSNASIKGEDELQISSRCFKAVCASDNQSVDVNIRENETVNCKYPNQVINLDNETKTFQGIMKCPSDFDLFCNFPRSCVNNCSNNGVCNNGYCVCLNGWSGEDCSKQCPSNSAWDGSRCVSRCPSGLFKNFDNTCKPTCPYKQYRDSNQNTCELCHVNCSVCSGPAANQCTACNNGYTLSGNQCVDVKCHDSCFTCSGAGSNQCTSCAPGKFLDSNKTCKPCNSPCFNCANATQCITCVNGYFMNDFTGQCTSNNSCHSSCVTCSAWREETKCTSCRDGYYLSNEGKCLKCENQCKTCSGSKNACIQCNNGYIYDSQNKSCNLDCDKSCVTCSAPQDSKSCTYCTSGKYLKNGQCLPCHSSCDLCKDSATFCIRCKYGETLDSTKGTCNSTCKIGEYLEINGGCKRCTSPCASCQYYDNFCISCISGYSITESGVCYPGTQSCHISCNTCSKNNDDKACDSCKSGMYLSNGSCINCPKSCSTCSNGNTCTNCQSGFQLQNGQCIEKSNIQCHSSCKTCSATSSGNRTYCTSCNDGQFLQGDSCLPCQLPCKTCSGSSNTCLSCDNNLYNYNPQTKSCDTKTCHTSCKTCSKPNDSFSCQSCYDGYIIQGQSCQPCSQNCQTCSINASNCTQCSSGFELKNGVCQQKQQGKCDSSCATCFKDNDPLGCLTCPNGFWIQTNTDKSLARCLPCDSSCKSCKSTYECISCPGEFVLDQNNYCIPCPSDKKFENGKCVNKTSRQVNNTICDSTCSSCVGTYYDQCIACSGNRVLQKKSNLNYGNCVCPQGTTDVNEPICQISNNLQSNIKTTTSTTFAASAATSTILSASTSNPVAALGMMEFSQSISYLSYVNKKTPVGFDDTMNAVSYSHTSNLFNFDSYAEQDAENEKQIIKRRNLEQNESIEIEIDEEDEQEIRNPKFSQHHKTKLFLINALVLIIINVVVWTTSGILSLFKVNEDKNSLLFKLQRIYNISIPIVVFTLSSQEFSLLMFLQMLNLKTITGLQILSTVFSFLTLIYIVGFIVFLFYSIEYKRVLSDSSENSLVWQQRFYLIYKFIKQDNFFTRNFVQITVLRKVLISFITACVVSSSIAQISLLLLCYTSYLIYLTICRPFKSNLNTIMMIILDSIIVLIHVLYCVMFAYEGDSEKEKVISLMMLFLTFSVFFAYLAYTLVIICKISYNLFKKWQEKRQNKKSYVKRPQVELENPDIIEQQVANLSQKSRNPSQNVTQSINHLDERGMVFSGEILVKS